MKDIRFTVKQQKREIGYIFACLFLAFGVNVYSIIRYNTEWKELYTQWFVMLVLAMVFYFLLALISLVFRFFGGKWNKK